MKVKCDVCEQAAATIFCCADEAALCSDCDLCVHAANKLAGKHERLPLILHHPPSCCDICQDKSGFFFCVEDRALLCRDCDVCIHGANELTKKHTRLLVSGLTAGLEAMVPESIHLKTLSSPSSLESKTKDTSTDSDICVRSKASPHPPSLQTSTCSSFIQATAKETTTRVAKSPLQVISEPISAATITSCPSLSPPSGYPLSWAAPAVNEPLSGYGAPMLDVSSMGWSALSCGIPIDALPTITNYLFEDATAEVPSTPLAAYQISCFQDFNLLKRKGHADEPCNYARVAPTFVVPSTMFPPCKQSRIDF